MKKALIALTLALTLSMASTSHIAVRSKPLATNPVDNTAIEKWKQEAQQYDAAIREIEGILRLNLTTKEGSDEAERILDRNIQKLHFAKAKIASGSLKFASFKNAVEEESAKRGGNEKFARAIKSDASLARNIRGIQEVARGMEAEIQPSILILRRVADAFAKAAKKQNAGNSSQRSDTSLAHHSLVKARNGAYAWTSKSLPVPANTCQDLGISVSSGICTIILGVILAHLSSIDGNQSCINPCIDKKISLRSSCQAKARDLIWPLNIPAISSCKEQFLGGVAGCIVGCD